MVVKTVQTGEIDRLMREGQAAAKRGDKIMARALLTQALERDPHNERAWMWLSGAVADPFEQQTCLENVMIINPENQQARQGLEFIAAKTGVLSPLLVRADLQSGENQARHDQGTENPVREAETIFDMNRPEVSATESTSPLDDGLFADLGLPEPGSGMEPPWVHQTSQVAEPVQNFDIPGTAGAVLSPNLTSIGVESVPNAGPADQMPMPEPDFSHFEESWGGPGGLEPFAAMNLDLEPMGEAPVYTGGPPTPGLPPDLESAVPEWVRPGSSSRVDQTAEPPNVEPFVPFEVDAPGPVARSNGSPSGGSLPVEDADAIGHGIDAWLDQMSKQGPTAQAVPSSEQEHSLFDDGLPLQAAAVVAHEVATHDPNFDVDHTAHDPFAGGGMDPMGPYNSIDLPSPEELPGGSTNNAARPWYLQNSGDQLPPPPGSSADQANSAYSEGGVFASAQDVATVDCPHCHKKVPETSLACPDCRFNFFVHCPHCHELVDAGDARPGLNEGCPYCAHEINRYELGMIYATGGTPPVAEAVETAKHWTGSLIQPPKRGFTLRLAWLVDVLWLVVIALMVWALTQLPAWFHLTGLYS